MFGIVFAMTFGVCPIVFAAQPGFSIGVNSSVVTISDDFELTVDVTGIDEFYSYEVALEYNTNALSLSSYTGCFSTNDSFKADAKTPDGLTKLIFTLTKDSAPLSGNQRLVAARFKPLVSGDIALKVKYIKVIYQFSNDSPTGIIYNIDSSQDLFIRSFPVFTDGNGNPVDSVPAGIFVTALDYRNVSAAAQKLNMVVGVYEPDGRLLRLGFDEKQIAVGQSVNFKVTLDLPSNGGESGYYAQVFLWDAVTYEPVLDKYVFPSVSGQQMTYASAAFGNFNINAAYEEMIFGTDDGRAMTWLVIDDSTPGYKTLLLKDVLSTPQSFSSLNSSDWENSSIRSWLNSTFIYDYFSNVEKSKIVRSVIPSRPVSTNPVWNPDIQASNPAVDDFVYMLSAYEFEHLANSRIVSAPYMLRSAHWSQPTRYLSVPAEETLLESRDAQNPNNVRPIIRIATDLPTGQNSTVNAGPYTFNLNSASVRNRDVEIGLTLNGNAVSDVALNDENIPSGSAYVVGASSVIIKKGWLDTREVGNLQLKIKFTGGQDAIATIAITDSAPQNSSVTLAPGDNTFDVYPSSVNNKDLAAQIELNGNTLLQIKYRGYTLSANADYTLSSNGVTIKKSFLSALPLGSAELVFTFSDGAPQSVNISIVNTNPETAIVGDLNYDGIIDMKDLAVVAYYYGSDYRSSNWALAAIADLNSDNTIDDEDTQMLIVNLLQQ